MIIRIIAIIIFVAVTGIQAQWRSLEPGLEFARFRSPHHPNADSSMMINILRIDTKRYNLRLLNASHPNQGSRHTARGWAQKEGMTAVINAAMYQMDYLKSVSFMKTSDHVNNSYISRDRTILLFEPLQQHIPPVRIVDLDCDDFDQIRPLYGSAVQSIRMISCMGRNVWQQNDKRWSIAAIGIDKSGNLLFIQSTAPHSVHDFINVLRGLPISIDRAMYMEGGSPSQMYINTARDTLELIGDYSSGGRSFSAPEIPNALGIRPKK
ncbi:MAG: phosphodiester glycosidase family protein [Chitinispirillales bacterium]|jgi:uncharacterized protein YigE (DUF2233 family)|nr:phosphodiester glycosidase family protein [Chitinispirillales bacterium]